MKTSGKQRPHPEHMYVMHVWEKNAEGWQMVARQATLISIEQGTAAAADIHGHQ